MRNFCFSLMFTVGLLVAAPVMAVDAPPPQFYITPIFTNGISTNGVATATGHRDIDVPPGKIMLLQCTATADGPGTSNVVVDVHGTLDSTAGWTTAPLHSPSFALNGTNPTTVLFKVGTNINARQISIDRLTTTQTNAVTLSNWRHAFINP